MRCRLPSCFLLAWIVWGLLAVTGRPAESPPFAAALDRAAVCRERLDRVLDDSLILGNGDLNGLLFQSGGGLVSASPRTTFGTPGSTRRRTRRCCTSTSGPTSGPVAASFLPVGTSHIPAHGRAPRSCWARERAGLDGNRSGRKGKRTRGDRGGGTAVMAIEGLQRLERLLLPATEFLTEPPPVVACECRAVRTPSTTSTSCRRRRRCS